MDEDWVCWTQSRGLMVVTAPHRVWRGRLRPGLSLSISLHLTPPEQGEGCVGMDSLPHGMRPALALALVSELLSVWLSSI